MKILRNVALERHPSTVNGVAEREMFRMQEWPVEVQNATEMRRRVSVDSTVDGISDDRVPDGVEVDANLVRPPRRDCNADQRHTIKVLRRHDACDCLARSPRARRDFLSVRWVSTDR